MTIYVHTRMHHHVEALSAVGLLMATAGAGEEVPGAHGHARPEGCGRGVKEDHMGHWSQGRGAKATQQGFFYD